MSVPTGDMKVGDALLSLIGYTNVPQDSLDHQPGFVSRISNQLISRLQASELNVEKYGDIGM